MADEKITKFIDKILSQPFDKSDVKFKNEDELNKYLIRTIKETGN